MMKSIPTACRHFNMIEMLTVEENKKKGGIGVSSKNKASSRGNNNFKGYNQTNSTRTVGSKDEEKRIFGEKSGNKSDCGQVSSNGQY